MVALPKFIRAIPRVKHLDPVLCKGWKIESQVFNKADPTKPIKGLIVIAKAHEAPTGLPHPTPSAALTWHGERIRGLNYELWHDNPDGTNVRGWHEHVWSPEDLDARVIQARPEIGKKQLIDILRWGLDKWNIEVQEEQDDFAD